MTRIESSPDLHLTRISLSDGRQLLYFDEQAGATHDRRDQRALETASRSSQLRWDVLNREWTVIADHRQTRTFRPPTSDCPLCPTRPGAETEIPDTRFDVVVFENRFPSLAAADPAGSTPDAGSPEPVFRQEPGAGRCEVVVFTDDHSASFASLSRLRVETVIGAWAQRTSELRAREDVAWVYCFENRGDEIGVTLAHPHGQIYAYPFLPVRAGRALATFEAAASHGQGCPQCVVLEAELAAGSRIVTANSHWVAYVPFAARWPFEVRIAPRRHLGSLFEVEDVERRDLASIYLAVLKGFDALWDKPAPYIAGWNQAPVKDREHRWHLSADIFTIRRTSDKLKYLAGSESGAGVWINDVTPESAAERLRRAVGSGS